MLKSIEEKFLDLYFTPNLNLSVHTTKVAAKANIMFERMIKTLTYVDKDIFWGLYQCSVHPLMKCPL